MAEKKKPKDKIKHHAKRILDDAEFDLIMDAEDFSEFADDSIQEAIDSHISDLESDLKNKLGAEDNKKLFKDTRKIQSNLHNIENKIIEKVLDDSQLMSSQERSKIIEKIQTKEHDESKKNYLMNKKLNVKDHEKEAGDQDGTFDIKISNDNQKAILSCQPSYGKGKEVTIKDIVKKINELEISFGLKEKELKKILLQVNKKKQPCNNFIIAQGRPTQDGKDAVIELNENFQDPQTIPALRKLQGKVCMIQANDKILTYIEPTRGTAGIDIFGNKIQGADGKGAIEFGNNVITQRITNNTQVIANVSGIAHFFNNKIAVHESKDAKFEIIVSHDNMQAYLKLLKSKGIGKKLNIGEIKTALSEKGITAIVNGKMIAKCIEILNTSNIKNIQTQLAGLAKISAEGEVMILCAQGRLPGQGTQDGSGYDIFKNIIRGDSDASFEINITGDKLKASLICHPPVGAGKLISVKEVMSEIKKLNISFGLKTKEIEKMIKEVNSKKEFMEEMIAVGKPPQRGQNSIIKLNENFQDARDVPEFNIPEGKVCKVNTNDPLLTFTKPQKGIQGTDIFGEIIPPEDGTGEIHLGDNILQREISGHLQIIANASGIAHYHNDKITVHEISDSLFKLYISKDKLQAVVYLKAAVGTGKPLVYEEIIQHLMDQGIKHIINQPCMQERINLLNGYAQNINTEKSLKEQNACSNEAKMTDQRELQIVVAQGKLPSEKNGEVIHGYDIFNNIIYGDVDGSFELKISDDKMSVTFNCEPAFANGNPVSVDDVLDKTTQLEINFGLNTKKIEETIELVKSKKEPCVDIIIAEGKQPENGKDGVITLEHVFHDAASDMAESSLKGQICLTDANEVLMSYEEPTKGIKGKNVLGEDIFPVDGRGELKLGKNVSLLKVAMKQQVFAQSKGIAEFHDNFITIHESYDALSEIKIAEDKMSAEMVLIPSRGVGKKFDINNIVGLINNNRIKHSVNMRLLEQCVNVLNEYSEIDIDERNDEFVIEKLFPKDLEEIADEIEKETKDEKESEKDNNEKKQVQFDNGKLTILVAKGKLPEHGRDEEIKFFVDSEITTKFKEDSYGRIDFREKKNLVNIEKNQKLFTILPPTPAGADGYDIFDKSIKSIPGKKSNITICDNIKKETDFENGIDYYYSLIDGRFVYEKNSFIDVRKVMSVNDLDLNVGNIYFTGDLFVSGKVHDGMKIELTGDLYVNGNIEAADIKVDGNINCKGGIMTKHKGRIVCSGDLNVKFIENSNVKCLGELKVIKAILNSLVICNTRIIVKGEQGSIMGGNTKAKEMIKATSIGSPHGIKTLLNLGYDYSIYDNYVKIRKMIDKLEKKDFDVNGLINMVQSKTDDINTLSAENKNIYDESLKAHLTLQRKILELKAIEAKLLVKLENDNRMELIIEDTLYSDVVITFRDKSLIVSSKDQHVAFVKEPGEDEIAKKMLY